MTPPLAARRGGVELYGPLLLRHRTCLRDGIEGHGGERVGEDREAVHLVHTAPGGVVSARQPRRPCQAEVVSNLHRLELLTRHDTLRYLILLAAGENA